MPQKALARKLIEDILPQTKALTLYIIVAFIYLGCFLLKCINVISMYAFASVIIKISECYYFISIS